MTPEGKVKAAIKTLIARLKAEGIPIKYDMYIAGPRSKKGRADFIICVNGLYLESEAKAENKYLTPLQIDNRNITRKAGGFTRPTFGVIGVESLERVIRKLYKLSKVMQTERIEMGVL